MKWLLDKLMKKPTPKVLDFSNEKKRHWGHEFGLLSKIDEIGWKWKIVVWHTPAPEVGDFILMRLNNVKKYNDRTAIVTKVNACGNPSDMYFLEVNIKGANAQYEKMKKNLE